MRKKSLLILASVVALAGQVHAQNGPCSADQHKKELIRLHPEIATLEAQLNQEIAEKLQHIDLKKAYKHTTDMSGVDSFWYDIPIVVHIIHDFGAEYMTDDEIFNDLIGWNQVYACQNSTDTSSVIPPFKKYIGNPHIRLHLATKDPLGNPTKGITRKRSYLTHNGGDQAKFQDWDPTSYINIWFINQMSVANGSAAAYAMYPSAGATIPYSDGVISLYDYAANTDVAKTINHEIGHVLNIKHPWGDNNDAAGGTCADGGTDDVDDTPPTIGHMYGGCGTPRPMYDTQCATNYYKLYTSHTGLMDSLVNYPDTTNSQNIMDYTYCAKMFTKGQVARMHAALNSTVAGRVNLWSPSNLAITGALAPRPDLKPIPDFSVTYNGTTDMRYFTAVNVPLRFNNKSWNDTVTKVKFTFNDGSTTINDSITSAVSFSSFIKKSFPESGWVDMSVTATGNHTGDSSIKFPHVVYVAEKTPQAGASYYGEFNPSGDLDKWPIFNYYNNEFKWESANVGLFDNYSMKYDGYDSRINSTMGIFPTTGSPYGDIDDVYSRPVDLSSFSSGNLYLNFWTSGASRSANVLDINDSLQIYMSTDSSKTWSLLQTYDKGNICNMGTMYTPYTPTSASDWVPKSINIPTTSRKSYVLFRFRYKPGTIQSSRYTSYNTIYSSGNNFYLDRVSFNAYTAEVEMAMKNNVDVTVAPNPTSGTATVVVKEANNNDVQVSVFDITGKMVYSTTEAANGGYAKVEIPAEALSVKGIYLVKTSTGAATNTQKLIVY